MTNSIEVARHRLTIYARVNGLGNFNNAGPFREFIEALIQDGARELVLDLKGCQGLDSTFMGTLMGFLSCPLSADQGSQKLDKSEVRIVVVNVSPPARRAINSVGLPAILDVRDEAVTVPDLKLETLKEEWLEAGKRVRLIREAHEHLIHLDKANEAKFAPFLKMLLQESKETTEGGA